MLTFTIACAYIPGNPPVQPGFAAALAILPSKPEQGLIGSEFHTTVAVFNEQRRLLYQISIGDESCDLLQVNPGRYVLQYSVKYVGTTITGSTRVMSVNLETGDLLGIRTTATGAGARLVRINRDTARLTNQDVAALETRLRTTRLCSELPSLALAPAG